MATDKKKSPDTKAPEKKNTDAKILAFVERCENPGENKPQRTAARGLN